jgi:hypothetical protein
MALGTAHESLTTLDVLIPEVWGQKINDYFKDQLVAASFFTNRSDELVEGGDVIRTPNLTAMTAATKTNGSQVTLNNATETTANLTVTTWKEVSFLIEDREAAVVSRSYNLQKRYAMNAGFEAAGALESAICALFSGFSTTVGASTTNLADSEIRSAIASLATAKVTGMTQDTTSNQDVAFFVSPNVFWKQIQNIDKFSLAINSPVNDPTGKRPAGYLYGIPVFITTYVINVSGGTGRYNALAHRDAIHWAAQSMPLSSGKGFVGDSGVRVQTSYIQEYLGYLTTADICYGVVENRDASGVTIITAA